ncbi:MAG: VUT family protein [Rhodospirillales bacterium]|nr:VUT family protein [Rhodospirillales bacterium]
MHYKFTALYIALIVAVNYAFSVVPLVELPDGTMWPPVALAVGFIFVVRDFAQREIGHKVLLAMLVGVVISYFMADPFVATASAAAFLVSELVDWAVYSFTKRPLSQRILFSSLLGAPVDSAVFLGILGLLSPAGVVAMSVSKLLGAFLVWWMIRRREQALI